MLVLRGEPKRALISLRGLESAAWPLGTDARLCEAEALMALGESDRAQELLARERLVISRRRDHGRMDRWRALSEGRRFHYGGDPASAAEEHLKIAERNTRSGDVDGALDHYRAARALLEL